MRIPILVGQRFGRLVVLREVGTQYGNVLWLCRCDCTVEKHVTSSHLWHGGTRSCGCFMREMAATKFRTHGHTVGRVFSPTYDSWVAMISRTTNCKASNYCQYGGTGVSVASEWVMFEGFLKSMGERPEGCTLGRILDMGNYEPGNVFWMTKPEQNLAQRNKNALLKLVEQQAA